MTSSSRPDWHALLAPLPPDAKVRRGPVTPEELRGKPEMAPVAGWENLSVDLSAGPAGLRHVMVVLDASGTPIAASDWVLYCDAGAAGEYLHENIGGRLEADGSFRGTRWRSVTVEVPGSDDAEVRESHHSEPSREDAAALKKLVEALLRLAPAA